MSNTTSIIDADLSLSFTPEVLKALQGFLSNVNNGVNIKGSYAMSSALAKQGFDAAEAAYVKSNPEVAQLFEERYLAPTADLDKLLKLPEDSLGFAYASYMRSTDYVQDYYPPIEVVDDASYYYMRVQQTHDIWHAVTGWFGEAGGIKLAAFQIAQTRSSFLTLVITSGILNEIKMNKNITPIVHLLYEGYDVGSQTKPFLAKKWEEAWEKPVADWRSELNFNVT
jgi:ubiquinone biosynthesis protein COQ4